MNMRKDIAISFMGHLSLMAIIIIVNPATGVLRGTPEVMTVDLAGLAGPAPAVEETIEPHQEEIEAEPIDPPEIPETVSDEIIDESFALASNDTLETIIEEPEPVPEPEKPKPKPKPREKPPEPEVAVVEEDSGPKEITSSAGRGLEIASAVGEGDGVAGEGGGSGSSVCHTIFHCWNARSRAAGAIR